MSTPSSLRQAVPGFSRFIRHLWPFIRQHRPLLGGSFVVLFATVGLRALEPWPLKFVFDYAIVDQEMELPAGFSWMAGQNPLFLVSICAVALIAIIGLRAVSTYYFRVGFALVGNRVMTEVRATLYAHLHSLSLTFHNKSRGGDLIVRVIGDIGRLKDVAITALMPLLASLLILVVMGFLMVWINWRLALVVLAVTPLYWVPTSRLGRRIRSVSRDQRKREGAMAATASESLGAMQVVQALSLEKTFSDAFASENAKSLKEGVKAKRLAAKLQGSVNVMTGVSTSIVLWYGTVLVLQGALTPGELLVFLSYLKAAFRPIRDFAKYTTRIAKASAAGERVIEVLTLEPEVKDLPGAIPAPALRGSISFENVGFEYDPGHSVLENVNFHIVPGQRVALLGASGAGKSTVVGLISRLYDPQHGRVLLDGRDVRSLTLDSLRSQISFVLQDTLLFRASIRDNIAYGAPDVTDEQIAAAAHLARVDVFVRQFPEGYDTVVGERGVTLSVGQRQRIAVARAAVRKAPILILDEPTTGLDEVNEREVLAALDSLSEGRTTLLITHDLDLAARADRILLVRNKTVVEQATHSDDSGRESAHIQRLMAERLRHIFAAEIGG